MREREKTCDRGRLLCVMRLQEMFLNLMETINNANEAERPPCWLSPSGDGSSLIPCHVAPQLLSQ